MQKGKMAIARCLSCCLICTLSPSVFLSAGPITQGIASSSLNAKGRHFPRSMRMLGQTVEGTIIPDTYKFTSSLPQSSIAHPIPDTLEKFHENPSSISPLRPTLDSHNNSPKPMAFDRNPHSLLKTEFTASSGDSELTSLTKKAGWVKRFAYWFKKTMIRFVKPRRAGVRIS